MRVFQLPKFCTTQAIEKWNGQFPTVMGSNEALPLINITRKNWLKASPCSGEIKIKLFITPILFLLGRGRSQTVNCQLSTVNC
ncbi:MAG: hypothetical protein EAZ39_06905 [Oscillatoriales cyanobacterium]|nr:MAG: hypothetical protein EAZ93_26845 [Oscillatoriales cyanobacterium]TAE52103.1 MAG: hypothetical protein EAZ88_16230 [Oscillatoriales cyanobacterium]TAE63266.1 MAG: hypothetical protein EAZ86_29365 [Oscillatoriales cyanobacterium]TAG20499.1 MAG: hypothetical protein EAZ39_06905 [Oscillatoriales cyanobacterium]TAG34076.1 MAG: hypothetical protein EAZ33_28325 [Oscillatoriales cyanobacterium]